MGGDADTFPEQQPWNGAVSDVRRRRGMDMGRSALVGGDVSGRIPAVPSDEGVPRGRESVRKKDVCRLRYQSMNQSRKYM